MESHLDDDNDPMGSHAHMHVSSGRAKFYLSMAAILSAIIFWAAGDLFHIPPERGMSASLLQQPSAVVAVLVTLVTLVGSTLICTLWIGRIRFDAGFLAASAGMAALSARGGPMRYVLFYAPGSGVYLMLAFELILLFAALAAAWWMLHLLHQGGILKHDPILPDTEYSLNQNLLALATQVIVMTLLMSLIAQSDSKKQALIAVGISSLFGAAIAAWIFPARSSVWYWTGPLIVGLIGYCLALSSAGAWNLGFVSQPLAAPLPLDYASFGPAGAIFGYWMGQSWRHTEETVTIPIIKSTAS